MVAMKHSKQCKAVNKFKPLELQATMHEHGIFAELVIQLPIPSTTDSIQVLIAL